jgi:RND family efflux transporter MFP subunit
VITCRKKRAFQGVRSVSAWGMSLLLLVLLVACKEKTSYAPPPPPKVTVSQPVRRVVTDYLELTGNTQAVNTVQLVARVAGYLEKVFFQDGQLVKKGQLLFLIQKDTYEARLQQAEGQILLQKTQLDYAQKELIRYTNLLQQKAAAQTDVDNWRNQRDSAQANLVAAEAQWDLAKLDLSYTRVCAPIDGRIDRRLVDPGNLVGSGGNTVLAQLNQIDPINVYFTISDLDLARLMRVARGIPGQGYDKKWPVSVGLPNEEGYPHKGHLDFASISLTPTTGTLLMRGVFSNPDGRILPGLYARVHVPVEKKALFLVPAVAVSNDQQGSYVLIVNEKDMVERRNVKTGPLVDNLYAIEGGLNGKEWVITKGLLRVAAGRQVTAEQEKPPATSFPESAGPRKGRP